MNTRNNYPRLLIVTLRNIFKDNCSETFTVRSLLENWPQDNIIQLICEDFNSGKCGRLEKNEYKLGHKDLHIVSWLIKEERTVKTALRKQIINKSNINNFSLKKELINCFVDIYGLVPYKITKGLINYVEEAQPEAIYCNTSSPRMYEVCYYLSRRFGIPFYPHILDDWPNIICKNSVLSTPLRKWYHKRLSYIIHKSPSVFCICEYMCELYEKRYNYYHFVPIMHSVDPLDVDVNQINQEKELVYAGSLYLERYKSIKIIAESISKNNIGDLVITICTHEKQWEELKGEFEKYPFVKCVGFLSQAELMKKISRAYGLLFVESLDPEMLEYTKLSMSTKIPEYLSSGKPILAIGNKEQGSIRYLLKNFAGYVITDLDSTGEIIQRFASSEGLNSIIANAKRLFLEDHIKLNQQKKFLNCLNRI